MVAVAGAKAADEVEAEVEARPDAAQAKSAALMAQRKAEALACGCSPCPRCSTLCYFSGVVTDPPKNQKMDSTLP